MTTQPLTPPTHGLEDVLVNFLAKLPVHLGLMLISIVMWLSLVVALRTLVS
jgi:hypothetical protein